MKVNINVIDSEGGFSFLEAHTKQVVVEAIPNLAEGTEVIWNNKAEVTINEQYI